MIKESIQKGVACSIIAVFVGVSTMPLGINQCIGTTVLSPSVSPQDVLEPMRASLNFNFSISGFMGNDGWYTSPVAITIVPEVINITYYKLHADDPWCEYTGSPITVSSDGVYELYVFAEGFDGEYHVYGPFPFKIDQTPPFINVTVVGHWTFIVNCSDNMSGVAVVQFYIDDVLMGNLTPPGPFVWIYKGKGKTAEVAVFDVAGNVALSPKFNDNPVSIINQLLLSFDGFLQVRQRLLQMR